MGPEDNGAVLHFQKKNTLSDQEQNKKIHYEREKDEWVTLTSKSGGCIENPSARRWLRHRVDVES